jgi:hypothetical protein
MYKNIEGTSKDQYQIGISGPVLERITGTARLQLPDLLRWQPGGTTKLGLPIASTNGDLDILEGVEGDLLYHNGTNWTKLAKGDPRYYLRMPDAPSNIPEWVQFDSADIGGDDTNISFKAGIDIAFFTQSGVDYATVNSTSWQTMITYLFHGTSSYTPLAFKAITALTGVGTAGDIRVIDVTNGGNQVALISTATGITKTITSQTPLTNLPASEAIFEIQAKKVDKAVQLYFATMR